MRFLKINVPYLGDTDVIPARNRPRRFFCALSNATRMILFFALCNRENLEVFKQNIDGIHRPEFNTSSVQIFCRFYVNEVDVDLVFTQCCFILIL